ncbi:MAG: hypothetical protein KJO07_19805, partial [Deltaproteobacteria bacterium]|nr:hypothetical protein [Deltaproteobacteria bacterium]
CVGMPDEGEPFKAFRTRLKKGGAWDRERANETLRFLQLPLADFVEPSELIEAIKKCDGDEDRHKVLADRLWHVNPLLFKAVIDLTAERPHTRDEIAGYVGSFAYRGEEISRVQLDSWFQMVLGLQIFRILGIAMTGGPLLAHFSERARLFEIDEFLEDDEDEPLVVLDGPSAIEGADVDMEGSSPSELADSTVPSAPPAPAERAVSYASPLGRGRQVPVSSFATHERFGDDTRKDTAERIGSWWAEQSPETQLASALDFGIDANIWMEGADEALYRLAVAAALAFRLERGKELVVSAYRGLDEAGVLGDLYYGTAPRSLPSGVDSQALMLASLVARRCAESPDLAVELEKQKNARDAFAQLEKALGRGLFLQELFWMMRALGEIGAVRFDDLRQVSALPTRLVRDTLYRLGFLTSPYAHDARGLLEAASAAGEVTDYPAPDVVVEGFALAAGCSYDCPHRRTCDFACRERADAGAT